MSEISKPQISREKLMTLILTKAICRCNNCNAVADAVISNSDYGCYMEFAEPPPGWFSCQVWRKKYPTDPDDELDKITGGNFCSLHCIWEALGKLV